MSREATQTVNDFKQKAKACLTNLRDVGQIAKNHIDSRAPAEIICGTQYVAASILSEKEIIKCDYAEFNTFKKYLGENPDCPLGFVHQNRTAVLVNKNKDDVLLHGEQRLFGSLTDVHVDGQRRPFPNEEVLNRMLDAFRRDYPSTQTGIILLYSVHIPCTIAKHECARVLEIYAKLTNHRLIVGFDTVHKNTDEENSLTYLKKGKITVFLYQDPANIDDFVDDLLENMTGNEKSLCRRMTKGFQAECTPLYKDWVEL